MNGLQRLAALFVTPVGTSSTAAAPTAPPPLAAPRTGAATGPAGALPAAPPVAVAHAAMGAPRARSRPVGVGARTGTDGVAALPRPALEASRATAAGPRAPGRAILRLVPAPDPACVMAGEEAAPPGCGQAAGEHSATPVPSAAPTADRADRAPIVGVLGGHRVAGALAGAVCLRAARGSRGRVSVLVLAAREGSSPPGTPRLPRPAARRLARALRGADLDASACGPVVTLAPPAEGMPLAALVGSVTAAHPDVPVVLVLPAVRDRALDGLLALLDAVVLPVEPERSPALVGLARGELELAAPRAVVTVVELPARPGPGARRAVARCAREVLA